MMPLLFGDRADAVRKGKRLRKILEAEFLLEVMFADHAPLGAEVDLKPGEFRALQRRIAPAAGQAFLCCE